MIPIPPITMVAPEVKQIIRHPAAFALQVLRAFRANQGLLLAGAVAYYTLLSIVPLLILVVIGLSHVVDQAVLFDTLRRALAWVVPGQANAVVQELAAFRCRQSSPGHDRDGRGRVLSKRCSKNSYKFCHFNKTGIL